MSAPFYHPDQRRLQDSFGSRALADRLAERTRHDRFTDQDAAFIAAQSFFVLATADPDGRPDASFKGGPPGFARVVAPDRLVFPDYDGNGMFRSLGNIQANPHVALLFVAMGPEPWRIRVNGTARVFDDHPELAATPGAQLIVEVTPSDIFPNCGRYIPTADALTVSPHTPAPDAPPLEPAWKAHPLFTDVLPPRRR
ncbi:pyridoxamine 5'-phosphate oxidase family protein [Phenylobacterium sp.]|jgi:predicted pyridoxine 5'-phosphate oxidase superfamily flavin-nucleotide-binding protein|uniref:pyridoxamine 5'-phosphate oxidase family protein n=1 Tax=Phenylobacterium sp. TaxID=1871053 RepID=UPI002F931163